MKSLTLMAWVLTIATGGLFVRNATAPSTGDGSSGNPYQIATLNNLYWIAASDEVVESQDRATRWAAQCVQTEDIDAAGTSSWNSGNGPVVYNLRGELVKVLKSTYALKGAYSVTWNPQSLNAGVCFIRLQSGNKICVQKIEFMK